MTADRSVLLLTRYGPLGSSSRLRFLQYAPWLERAGLRVEVSPLFTDAYLRRLYDTGRKTPLGTAAAYRRRLKALLRARRYDLVWLEKELFPFLPGSFETALARLGVRYVVDYDDATFHRYDQHPSGLVRRLLGGKLKPLIASARLVIAGNRYLADYVERAGGREVRIVPTVVDLDHYPVAPDPGGRELRVGWIGSPSSTRLLALVAEPLERLARLLPLRLVTIGAGPLPDLPVPIEPHPWSEHTEAALLATVHLGIMPLEDEPWQRGKCGYKLIQYMACGRPVVASPVGVNSDIVTDEVGFLAAGTDDWLEALHLLATDPGLRGRMGRAGRAAVERSYSLQVTGPVVAGLLTHALAR